MFDEIGPKRGHFIANDAIGITPGPEVIGNEAVECISKFRTMVSPGNRTFLVCESRNLWLRVIRLPVVPRGDGMGEVVPVHGRGRFLMILLGPERDIVARVISSSTVPCVQRTLPCFMICGLVELME